MRTTPEATVGLETALDFLNTLEHSRDGDSDHLSDTPAAIAWLVEHGAMAGDVATTPVAVSAATIDRVRAVRSALAAVVDAVAHATPADPGAVRVVNELLDSGDVRQLAPTPDGVAVQARHRGDPVTDALAHLAEPIVGLIASGDVHRLRMCDNETCRWVFYDASRTARRRWCDMTTCGNRAKAARHRARQRAGSDPEDAPAA
jgi:predicted RNA-binding Zn ribbon-like protein